jgi:choline dehydrogenase-like flavoprotein
VWIAGAEMLARKENFIELDPEVKDAWGIPVVKIHITFSDNEYKLIEDFRQRAEEWFRKAGGEVMPGPATPAGFPRGEGSPTANPAPRPAGDAGGTATKRRPLGTMIHEVGTARMSANPKDGVLNSYCQTHDIPNLYVFGGNAFPSTGDKHPTLTMMALAARGCDHIRAQEKEKKPA